jgi:hypothetical protein
MTDPILKPSEIKAPEAKIVSAIPRSKEIALDWPVEFDGKMYDAITVRRVSAAEVSTYVSLISQGDPAAAKLPTIDCPLEVWRALDADDAAKVEEACVDFLPLRLKSALENLQSSIESAQATGASSPPW